MCGENATMISHICYAWCYNSLILHMPHAVLRQARKVRLALGGRGRAETLVVLDAPAARERERGRRHNG